jgi:hypothetical protein
MTGPDKRNYRAWTPDEERELQSWVDRHPNLKWSERARKYSIERKPRTAESLRTKHRLLKKNIRRHQRSILTERSRHRQLSAKRQRRGQREAWLSSISINTPSPSEYDIEVQSAEMQIKPRQKPTSRSHHDQPTVQPLIPRARRPGARRMRSVTAPIECENARNTSNDPGGPTPYLSGRTSCSTWRLLKKYPTG